MKAFADPQVSVLWGVLVALLMANALFLALRASGVAEADHSFDGATCQTTPSQCNVGYVANKTNYFRVSANWGSPSQIKSRAEPGIAHAKREWSEAAGPQSFYCTTCNPLGDIFLYEYPAHQPSDPVARDRLDNVQAAAIAINWEWNGTSYEECYRNPPVACIVQFTQIYVNDKWDSKCSGGMQISTFNYIYAHEFGHVLGLADHSGGGNILMNNTWPTTYCYPETSAREPTVTDIGVLPPCGSPKGIRCVYNWTAGFQKWVLQTPTPLAKTGLNWTFESADHNVDGVLDLFGIKMNEPNTLNNTEVHILSGSTDFQTWILRKVTGLGPTDPTGWAFVLADWNRGGKPDLIAIKKLNTSSGKTEIKIYSGESDFVTKIFDQPSVLHQTNNDYEFGVGDWNGDGIPDLFVIKKCCASNGKTEVHIMNGADPDGSGSLKPFGAWLNNYATLLGTTDSAWTFEVVDYNRDGRLDVSAVKMSGSPTTEVHIMSGSGTPFSTWIIRTATPLAQTNRDYWAFPFGDWTRGADLTPDLMSVKKQGASSTEVHILAGN